MFILNSTVMSFMFIYETPLFEEIFLLVQGFIINLGLFLMYLNVFTRFKAYHESILYKYRLILQEKERQKIDSSTKEVRTFFIYICQMLIVQIIYQGSNVMQREYASELWVYTLADVILIVLMVSHILMYIGLSFSIKKAFKAE